MPKDNVAWAQFHGADITMSWYLVRQGDFKLITWGTGSEVRPLLFNLTADPGEMHDLAGQLPQEVARLEALLKQEIDYPSVSQTVADYNQKCFQWWVDSTGKGWEDVLAKQVTWDRSWAFAPDQSLDAVKSFLQEKPAQIKACRGAWKTEGFPS